VNPQPFSVIAVSWPIIVGFVNETLLSTKLALTLNVKYKGVAPVPEIPTANWPGEKSRLAATVAVSCVAETKVVGRFVPFHVTLMPAVNPVPVTVTWVSGSQVDALFGEIPVITAGGRTVNGTAFE